MKIKSLLSTITTVFLIFLGNVFMSPVMARSSSGYNLKLLRSDSQSVVLEVKVDDYQIDTIEHEGQSYQRVIIRNTLQSARPGEPQVPTYGTMMGLPSVEGVSVQILDAGYETLSGYRLYPAPALEVTGDNADMISARDVKEVFVLNQDVYATDAFYPGTVAKVGHTGYMRNQPVAQVQFYPVHYNPVAGELRLYRRILARITWNTPLAVSVARMRGASPAYEDLLKSRLLNYSSIERPHMKSEIFTPDDGEMKSITNSASVRLKIGVTEDGVYKLTYKDLTKAGLNLNNLDPRTIRISNKGAEIPIYVMGEDDGVFSADDYILFYGTAITDMYTSKNIYWLTAEGGNGKRMRTVDGTLSGSAEVPTHFPATLHAEENDYYWQTIPDGEGQDHWFWGSRFSAPESRDYALTLNNISTTAGTATVRVRLKGRTDIKYTTKPDHHTKVYLNGAEIDDQVWDGMAIFDHEISVPHSTLTEGINTIRVEAVGDTGVSVDQVFVNWIEIDYFDTYVTEDDKLLFTAPAVGTFQCEVAGFSNYDVEVFDITDPTNVALLINTSIVANGSAYTVQFEDTVQTGTRYLAQTHAQRKSPASIEKDQPSSWKSTSNGADYIIITHEDFYASATRLARHRSKSGLRVATVKVNDLYDEFNDGIFNPQAIRDFLVYAYNNWTAPAPVYVLLMGEACYDYRDNLRTGVLNYVPAQVIETKSMGETPSDNWFVLVSGDDILPDMFIGRLSAETKSQADDIVDKIIYYERKPPKNSWNKNVLLVADDDSVSFEKMSEELANLLSDDYVVNKVYVDDYPPGDPTKDIVKYIDKGSLLVNYTGHGAVGRWGVWNDDDIIFRLSDIRSLNNIHKFPLVTVADCMNGYFTGTNPRACFAEEFQRLEDRGGSSGLGRHCRRLYIRSSVADN